MYTQRILSARTDMRLHSIRSTITLLHTHTVYKVIHRQIYYTLRTFNAHTQQRTHASLVTVGHSAHTPPLRSPYPHSQRAHSRPRISADRRPCTRPTPWQPPPPLSSCMSSYRPTLASSAFIDSCTSPTRHPLLTHHTQPLLL